MGNTISQMTPAAAEMMMPPQSKPTKVQDAAKQFEGLMIAQMLKSVRESGDDQDDNASATMRDVADQQFSQVLANNGGVGLANLVVKGLK